MPARAAYRLMTTSMYWRDHGNNSVSGLALASSSRGDSSNRGSLSIRRACRVGRLFFSRLTDTLLDSCHCGFCSHASIVADCRNMWHDTKVGGCLIDNCYLWQQAATCCYAGGMKPERTVVLSFRLPERLVKRVDTHAEKETRTRTNMVQVLLQEALDERDKEKK